MIGARIGARVGIGDSATVAIAGVTRDALNGNYYPANTTEWGILLAAAGDSAGGPASTWLFQNASGNVVDTIGSVPLTPTSITLFQQPVPGAARVCIRGVDGTANSRILNSTTAPNPALTSMLVVMFVDIPSTPAAIRDVLFLSNNADIRYNSTGKLRLIAGANADLASTPGISQRWVAFQINNTAATIKVFTDQEKFIGTYALPVSLTMISFGGQASPIAAMGYAYAAQFTGTAAERSEAQIKKLLQTLGATIPW